MLHKKTKKPLLRKSEEEDRGEMQPLLELVEAPKKWRPHHREGRRRGRKPGGEPPRN